MREAVEYLGWVFVANRDVACVKADPDVVEEAGMRLGERDAKLLREEWSTQGKEPSLVEIGQRSAGPEQPVGLRFYVQVDQLAPILPNPRHRRCNPDHVLDEEIPRGWVVLINPRAVGERTGRDAAVHVGGEKGRQNLNQP